MGNRLTFPATSGVAAKTADVKLGSVIPIMSIILVLCLIAAIIFTMRYAAKVKASNRFSLSVLRTRFSTF